jgi:hypothetical protein
MKRLLFLTLLLSGCGIVRPSGPAPVAWTESSDPDSIAAWVVKGCGQLIGTDRRCAERALYSVIEPAGVGQAMAALERVLARAPGLAPDAHGLAHGMGIAAYRSPETVGRTFASCPPTQMSGCYHGVIQGYFLALRRDSGSVSPAVLNAVCEEHRARAPLFFQCAHGLGHGVMALESHHLPRALARCDQVADRFVRENCYGGAFMENIVSVTHPHHTAEAHAGLSGGHGAAGHGDHAAGHAHHAEEPWVPLRRSDLLYPCTALGEQYQAQCYEMQTSAAISLTGGNVGAVARACGRAPAAHVRACYASLGRDVSALARMRPTRAQALCRGAGPAAEPTCLAGVASAFVNLAGRPADGIAFCRAVTGVDNKVACYRQVGDASVGLVPDPADREAVCATSEAEYVRACRGGAGLLRGEER